MEEEYITKIILELQPRSRRGYRRLFGIRENKYLNKETFDIIHFTKIFLNQYNKKVLQRGQHIKCENLIIAVKQIKCGYSTYCGNTEVEYRLKGVPYKKNEEKNFVDKEILNDSFIDKNYQNKINIQIEQVYSCYCSECKKSLSDGDFFIKTGNWSKPILCLSCYELLFTHKCVRCTKSITFHQNSLRTDGLACIRFVEHNDFYWHSDCCVCVTCLQSLIGKKYYQDQYYNQLFCLEHIPNQLE